METCKNKDWFDKISKAPHHLPFNGIAETLDGFHTSGNLSCIICTILDNINKITEEGLKDIEGEYYVSTEYTINNIYYCTETIRILVSLFENWDWTKKIIR